MDQLSRNNIQLSQIISIQKFSSYSITGSSVACKSAVMMSEASVWGEPGAPTPD